jgi:hypothetical protein
VKLNNSETKISISLLLLVAMSTFFYGCAASTRVVKNDKVEINTQDYVELYFIKPTKDPRHVVPQVIEEFKNKFGWGT